MIPTLLVALFAAGVILMAAGSLADWNERRDLLAHGSYGRHPGSDEE